MTETTPNAAPADTEEAPSLTCNICRVTSNSASQAEAHLKGKKHAACVAAGGIDNVAPPEPSPNQKALHLVIDAGALIKMKGSELYHKAENFWTVEEVMAEIRDSKAREHLDNLPFELKIKQPSAKAITAVADFARQTGDMRELSKPDLKILALTYHLEAETNGIKHLRTEPRRKNTGARVKSVAGKSMSSSTIQVPATAVVAEAEAIEVEAIAEVEVTAEAVEVEAEAVGVVEVEAEAVEVEATAVVEAVEVSAVEVVQAAKPPSAPKPVVNLLPKSAGWGSKAPAGGAAVATATAAVATVTIAAADDESDDSDCPDVDDAEQSDDTSVDDSDEEKDSEEEDLEREQWNTVTGRMEKGENPRSTNFPQLLDVTEPEDSIPVPDGLTVVTPGMKFDERGNQIGDEAEEWDSAWTDPADEGKWLRPGDLAAINAGAGETWETMRARLTKNMDDAEDFFGG